jgi:hypothetical protein
MSRHKQRTLDSGLIFSYGSKKYQIEKSAYSSWLPPKAKVTVMLSPYIGVKVAYKNMVFDTKPYKEKNKVVHAKEAESKPAVNPSAYRSENAWNPQDGMQWQPGLPTYQEVFDIVREIFERPYGKKKVNSASI